MALHNDASWAVAELTSRAIGEYMWYSADPSAPKTQAARMLIRITRMLSTSSELFFPIKAAMTIRLSAVAMKTTKSRTALAVIVPITAASLSAVYSDALVERLSILNSTGSRFGQPRVGRCMCKCAVRRYLYIYSYADADGYRVSVVMFACMIVTVDTFWIKVAAAEVSRFDELNQTMGSEIKSYHSLDKLHGGVWQCCNLVC